MRKILASVLALLLSTSLACAAVTANSTVSPQTPNRGIVQFLQGTDTAGVYKTLYTAGANGSVCNALWETNNDGSATHLVTVQIVNATVKYGGVAATTTSNQGFANSVPPLNLMTNTIWPGLPSDQNGDYFFNLASGDTLQATFATALTSTDLINLTAVCADY